GDRKPGTSPSDRGAGRVTEDGDDAALADPPLVVVAPGQHVVEVGDKVDAHVVDRGGRVDREVDPGGAGADLCGAAVGRGTGIGRYQVYPQAAVGVPGGPDHQSFG